MSKIKYVVGAGLVAAVILASDYGIANPPTPDDLPGGKASETLSSNLETAIAQKKRIGKQIVGLLKDEFDKVKYFIFENEKKEKNNDGTTQKTLYHDLVIRAYEVNEDGDWPSCGLNFDSMCRSIVKENKFGPIDVSDYIMGEDEYGNVIRCPESLKHSVAEQLNKIASYYIGNNAERCKYWVRFIQETHGPTGPDTQNKSK